MFPRQVRTPFPHPNAPGPWSHLSSNPSHLANLPVISLFPLPKLHHFCAPLLSSPSRGTWIEIILQGKGIKQMADDLQTRIVTMSRVSAIRSARTAVTAAQNAGRMDSYAAADKMWGIKSKKSG